MLNRFVKTVYKNKLIKVELFRDKFEKKERCRVVENNVVVILAFVDDEHILMERHYRAPLQKWVLELPAGHIDSRSPLQAAKRELLEETGFEADKMRLMYKAYTAPGILTTMAYTYLASGLEKAQRTDKEEPLTVKIISLKSAYRMVKNNKLKDKKSIAALLYYKEFFSK